MIRLLNLELVFLSKTRSNSDYVDMLKMRCNRYGIAANSVGQSGGLALLWRKDVEVGLLSYSRNHIDVEVRSPGDSMKWYFTGFYGFSEQNLRYRSWELLHLLETRNSPPWLVGGDFDKILSEGEKQGGGVQAQGLMDGFRDALEDCHLLDLGFKGPTFTWSNNRKHPHTVRCRLDRFCGSHEWLLEACQVTPMVP